MTASVWQRLAAEVKQASARARRDAASRVMPDMYDQAVENIRELHELRALLDELIDSEIIRGRELGASFDLLGSSRQQAQQRHARAVRQRALTESPM